MVPGEGGVIDLPDVRSLVGWLAGIEIGLAILAALAVSFVTAPYGRHVRGGWGPAVPARFGWMVMESPSVFLFGLLALGGAARPTAAVLSAMWLLHYVRRTFVWPFRMRLGGRTMPLSVVAMAFAFNLLNASANGLAVGWTPPPGLLNLAVGVPLFLAGFAINVWADGVLRALRTPGQTDYRVPHGGLYRWVSCPNYLGEIIEWCGWAVALWSPAGLAFALFTIGNLAPRARAHHRWYQEQFDGYPAERRALIPSVW